MRLMEKIQIRYSATSSPSTIRQAPSQAQQDGLNRTMFGGVRNGSGMATKDLQNHPKPTFLWTVNLQLHFSSTRQGARSTAGISTIQIVISDGFCMSIGYTQNMVRLGLIWKIIPLSNWLMAPWYTSPNSCCFSHLYPVISG